MVVAPFLTLSADFVEVGGTIFLRRGDLLFADAAPVGRIQGNRAYLIQPADIPGFTAGPSWTVPGDLSRLFQDAGGSTPALAGNPVGLFLDGTSGNLLPAGQSSAGSRPTLVQNGGKYALAFDGNDSLVFTPPKITAEATVVWSGKLSGLSGVMLAGQSNNGLSLWITGGKIWFGQLVGTDINVAHSLAADTAFVVSAQVKAGGTWRIRVNGVELAAAVKTAAFTGSTMGMMSQNGTTYWATGQQSYLYVSNVAESADKLATIEQLATGAL